MNKNIYNKITLFLLFIFDFFSNIISYVIIFEETIPFNYKTIFNFDFQFILLTQALWFLIFFLFNLYDTRSTLSRFDEIIKIFPAIYFFTVFGVTFDVFGLIDLNIDYKSFLSYGLLFSLILILGRFLIHSFQVLSRLILFLLEMRKMKGILMKRILNLFLLGTIVLMFIKHHPFSIFMTSLSMRVLPISLFQLDMLRR